MTAATVTIETWSGGSNGSPGTYSNVTSGNIRYRSDDEPYTNDTSAPITVPDTGYNYSRWITLGLNITDMGDASNIDNITFYPGDTLSWDLGTNGCINVLQTSGTTTDAHGIATADYDVADTADEDIASNHGAANTVVDLYDTFNSTNAMTVTASGVDYTGTGRTSAVVIEAKIDTDAPAGTQTGETLTFTYDEI